MGLGRVGTSPDSGIPQSLEMKHGVEENKSLLGFDGTTPPFLKMGPLALDMFPDNTKVGWGRFFML